MDEVWSWIASVTASADIPSPLRLVTSPSGRSITLSAHRTAESLAAFSISLHGFPNASNIPAKTLWISNPFPISSHNPLQLLLLLQLLDEVISLAPSPPHPLLPNLDSAQTLHALSQSPSDAASLLSLALLCRLFWLCAHEGPADAGFLFFQAFDASLHAALRCRRSLRAFLLSAGPHREQRFMRSVGYMLAKWCILRQLEPPHRRRLPSSCPAYSAEVHGLWVFKGYAPVAAMAQSDPKADPNDAVLRYALAHQQLETVVQMEHSICWRDPRFLKVCVRVDNIRIHVARFGEGDFVNEERHFPSRVRVRVGPAAGSCYAFGPSLGRSTGNPERVVESTRTVKGGFGFQKGGTGAGFRAKARWSARERRRSWRWEQEAESGAGVFDGVLSDVETGSEVAGGRMMEAARREGGRGGLRAGMRPWYDGARRAFSKAGGLVVAGDELPEGVTWRVGREMEGETVSWRMGVRVWVSYFPNDPGGYYETRWVEWEEEVELPLVAGIGDSCR